MCKSLLSVCILLFTAVVSVFAINSGCVENFKWKSCNCSSGTLHCHGDGVNQSLADNIHSMLDIKNIKTIELSQGKITELPAVMFGNCSNNPDKHLEKLTNLVLKNLQINQIHGKTFHCIPNVRTLDLSRNQWWHVNMKHTGYFRNLPKLNKLVLTDSISDESAPVNLTLRLAHIFYNASFENLEHLFLGRNELFMFDATIINSLCSAKNLKMLHLEGNKIGKIELMTKKYNCFPSLQKLNISYNVFSRIDQSTLDDFDHLNQQNEFTLDVSNNPFDCDCQIRPLVRWLKKTTVNVVGKKHLICHDGKNLHTALISLDENSLVCENHPMSNAGATVVIVLFVLIALVLIGVMIWKREHVKKFLKRVTNPVKNSLSNVSSSYGYSSVSKENLTV